MRTQPGSVCYVRIVIIPAHSEESRVHTQSGEATMKLLGSESVWCTFLAESQNSRHDCEYRDLVSFLRDRWERTVTRLLLVQCIYSAKQTPGTFWYFPVGWFVN